MEEIKVGDHVRSFDFALGPVSNKDLTGEHACYVEGVVEDIEFFRGCERYKIRVTRRVFGGIDREDKEDYVYPPVNGTSMVLGGVTNCVEKIA